MGDIATAFVIGILGGGWLAVWFLVSMVPVDPIRLPSWLRAMRKPVVAPGAAGKKDIAVPFVVHSTSNLVVYRLFLLTIWCLTQTSQIRLLTNTGPAMDSITPPMAAIG